MLNRILLILVALYITVLNAMTIDIFITDQAQVNIRTEARSFTGHDSNNLNIAVLNRSLRVNNKDYGSGITLSSSLPITINNISYKGDIKLSALSNNQVRVINTIDIEDYVAGVITAEMGYNAPLEALKAQAVATRTVTVTKVNNKHSADGYDLCNTTHCQVYTGLKDQTEQSLQAVRETEGLILTYNGEPIDAVYSSFCGGIGEDSGSLWRLSREYLQPKTDDYCINIEHTPRWSHKNLNWEVSYTFSKIARLVGLSSVSDIAISRYDSSTRVEEILVNDKAITGQYEIRNKFKLPSALFIIENDGYSVKFIGNGYGHGVGMCQIGAIARAGQGHDFREILGFYYPNTLITDKKSP
jgi:stage II sporulation protein D